MNNVRAKPDPSAKTPGLGLSEGLGITGDPPCWLTA